MKAMFSGYYTPTEEEFNTLWSECLFVFDTNTLLNLYRYSKESRDLLFKVMDTIKDRMWIPHQVALEYHKLLLDEIYDQQNAYKSIAEKIKEGISPLIRYLNDIRHSNINVEKIIEYLDVVNKKIQEELEKQKESHPNLVHIKERINELIGDNVGEEYTQEELDTIFKLGEQRYKDKIPPGFKDVQSKKGKVTNYNGLKYIDEYGDLVYWFQILKKSKEESVKSIILITDDNKEDWILKVKGEKKGPQPDLINEFKKESGNKFFYLYNTEQFIEYAKQYLNINEDGSLSTEIVDKAIEDVKSTKEFLNHFYYGEIVEDIDFAESILDLKYEYDSEIGIGKPLPVEQIAELKVSPTATRFLSIVERFIDTAHSLTGADFSNVSFFRSSSSPTILLVRFTSSMVFDENIIQEINDMNKNHRTTRINSYYLMKVDVLD